MTKVTGRAEVAARLRGGQSHGHGLVESRGEDIDVGLRRLGSALALPGASLEGLCSRAMETLSAQAPADDVTLLLARTRC
ncbi:hypothetical protein ABZ619_39400 [Streptomyces sp. NPDC007851]|uniref:hypothetical protein n=1 Tax=Streptomyces sp. NPDC007851 TaxID=3155008 RepID=UPI0033EDA689